MILSLTDSQELLETAHLESYRFYNTIPVSLKATNESFLKQVIDQNLHFCFKFKLHLEKKTRVSRKSDSYKRPLNFSSGLHKLTLEFTIEFRLSNFKMLSRVSLAFKLIEYTETPCYFLVPDTKDQTRLKEIPLRIGMSL